MIKLIVDSTFGLEEEYIKENDIKVVSLKLLLGDKTFVEGGPKTWDGFFEEYNKKELLWLHAIIRYYNYLITNKKERKEDIFETNNIERILCFDHVNRTDDSSVYKALIKNHNTNEFRQLYVDDGFYEFDKKINYCFMDEEEYEDAFSSLFDDNWVENHNIVF